MGDIWCVSGVVQVVDNFGLVCQMELQESLCIIQMSIQSVKKEKSSQLPLFIVKLLEMLENEELSDAIRWTTTNDSFIIPNISRFTDHVLPVYFKHRNYASFIRQLNIYSFRKVRHSDGDNVYAQDYFIRGKPHLLKHIVRKLRDEKEGALAVCPSRLPPQIKDKVTRDISDLKLKQKNLHDMCHQFLYHNQKLLTENEALVQKLERDYMDKEKRLEEFLIYLVAQKGYRALTDANALAVHHSQLDNHELDSPDATPLEVLANNIDQNESLKKMKIFLQNAFNGRASRRREKNFTIVPQKQQESPAADSQEFILKEQAEQPEELPLLAPTFSEDNGFLSLDAFQYADEVGQLDLDSSR